VRSTAAPILLFRRVPADGRQKGQVEFDGLALVERAELITQMDPSSGETFPNYRFDLLVLDLSAEGDALDWGWIDARRRPGASAEQSLRLAPRSWRRWVEEGPAAIDGVRRRVIGVPLVPKVAQLPAPGSREDAILEQIYGHYKRASGGRSEHGFEAVAELVARRVLASSGNYRLGWITRKSGDFGIDFVGRLDIGEGFATARLVVLGQAKCEKITVATSAQDLARTVARLRRGWLGVYVTTSFYSPQTQLEAAEDAYPLVLVNGLQVAQTVHALALEAGHTNVEDWLDEVDRSYPGRLRLRTPEEILAED
jgi:Restriction endonuclease AspBHI N-terminal/Restriction endonuclease